MSAAVELREVVRRLGGRPVLDGASLSLEPGARLTVAGRSGAGKTTLLRLIAGLDPPDSGAVILAGRTASEGGRVLVPPWERGVQLVFQNLALWPTRTARRHLTDALRARGVRSADAAARAATILERLGIAALARRRPGTLSGGEARRLAFARALALEPRVLLLDEPFASLDPVAREEGLAFLEEALAATNAAVILVTHEPGEARALGGEIAVLRGGRLDAPRPASVLCADDATFRAALEG